MATKNMEVELEKLREVGDFAAFAGAAEKDLTRMAADIHRRWQVPPGVDAEDLRQELLLAIVETKTDNKTLIERWDPTRGKTLAQFVVWQSYTTAKRYVHRQREASRRDGRAPSRFPLAFSSLVRRGKEFGDASEAGLEGVEEATQEEQVANDQLAQGFRDLLGSNPRRLAFDVLRAFGGGEEPAARAIASDHRLAMRCEVGSFAEAEELVRETVAVTRDLVRQCLA